MKNRMKMRMALLLSTVLSLGTFVFVAPAADPGDTKVEADQGLVQNTNEYKPSTSAEDCAACKKNLEMIGAAIQAYRKENKDVPNWLSDLVPKYLADTNLLICPVTIQTGRLSAFGVLDPKVRSSYLYEFTPTPIPAIVKGAWPGPMMTMRQWKRQQMGLVGSDVPIVRCLLHHPALNLSFGGKIYESPVLWEESFTDVVGRDAFSPH
jgi:hypothetical protein